MRKSYAFTYLNTYCKNKYLKVQEWLIDYYIKSAKRTLLTWIGLLTINIIFLIITTISSILHKDPMYIIMLIGIWPILNTISILLFLPISIKWYIKQKSWKRFNRNLDDKYLIEKTINPEATCAQLRVSARKYKMFADWKTYFDSYYKKNFFELTKEEQKRLVYKNLVLNYDVTKFNQREIYQGYLTIDMFKDDAKMVGIIE